MIDVGMTTDGSGMNTTWMSFPTLRADRSHFRQTPGDASLIIVSFIPPRGMEFMTTSRTRRMTARGNKNKR
jgi:hypothetical protein